MAKMLYNHDAMTVTQATNCVSSKDWLLASSEMTIIPFDPEIGRYNVKLLAAQLASAPESSSSNR